ncbi:uncharacterized protein LOC144440029 [Glandiceps talaboti]
MENAVYQPALFRCRKASTGPPVIALIVTGAFAPCVVVVICYILIFRFVRKSRHRVQASMTNQPTNSVSNGKKIRSAQELRVLKILLAVFGLILLGYLPFIVLITVARALDVSVNDTMILMYPCVHIAGAVNPILYGVGDRRILTAYRKLFSGQLIFGKRVRQSTGINANATTPRQLSNAYNGVLPINRQNVFAGTSTQNTGSTQVVLEESGRSCATGFHIQTISDSVCL